MKNKLLYAAPVALILMMSFAVAASAGGQSFRAELEGAAKLIHIQDDRNFTFSKADFSAYIPNEAAAPGKGSLNIKAQTPEGKKFNLNIKLENAVIETDSNTTLRVISDGYYYRRSAGIFGFLQTQKIEGQVTYSLNKLTGNTRIEGTGQDGMHFAVAGVPTTELRQK